jgi:hypothetical protein
MGLVAGDTIEAEKKSFKGATAAGFPLEQIILPTVEQ